MVEINPLLIRQPKSKVKTFDYLTYHDQQKFNHHMINHKNLFVTISLAMKKKSLSQD
jgi:hypothetical protein